MNAPEWVDRDVVFAIHEAQLAEHGGLPGLEDIGALESALAKPQNLFAYQTDISLQDLAGAYAFGIGKNHGFVDGNKRTACVACILFLELNGMTVSADQTEIVSIMIAVASGMMPEAVFVAWLKQQCKSQSQDL